MSGPDLQFFLIFFVVLLFSLSIHESAHAWTADLLGDPTGRFLGRVTLNPIRHIDPVGTILFPLIGAFSGVLFGWAKPVPVNPANLTRPRLDHLLIAAAGPGSNLLAAAAFLGILKGMDWWGGAPPGQDAILGPLYQLCRVGALLNVILAVFNLIPIPPLDGSWILLGLLPPPLARVVEQARPYGFVLLILLLVSGGLQKVLNPVMGVMFQLMN